ncbi:glycosyltransferase family 39 protein [Luedemannella helvata]|uniref:Glycosyltransferase RgtA/B/C/D-like domain-containing protein n=1 Tax=Luedemannella helvata TaxID=349315 RepID=A0ABN2JYN3_9ACTN
MTTLAEPPAVEVPPEDRPPLRDRARRVAVLVTAPLRRWPSRDAVIVAALVAVVGCVYLPNIGGFPGASDDEGTYLAQAWAVREGLGLAHYTYWYDHPPVGWLQLAALAWLPAAVAPDALAVAAGRYAMVPVVAIILALTYVLTRRLGFARPTAAAALLLLGLSPLTVTLYRQLFLDTFAVAWLLAALVLALSPRKHLWHHVAAGAAAAVAVLSKETMLVAVPAVAVALWQGTLRGLRGYSLVGATAGLALVGVFFPLYALLKGELFPGPDHVSLIGAWQFQLQNRTGSGSVFEAGSSANKLVQSWLFYDWVLPVAGAIAVVAGLFVRRLRAPALAAVLLAVMVVRPGGYLPAMYVIGLLPFFAIATVGLVEIAARRLLAVDPLRHGRRYRASVALLVASTVAAVVLVVPVWTTGLGRAVTRADNSGYEATAVWLRAHAPVEPHARVVLDDVLWLDAVNAGFERERVIWFYKLDLDTAVTATLPRGWRSVDYVISSPAMRADPNILPNVAAVLTHSHVVVTFGTGDDRIEIRRVDQEAQ